MASSSQTHADPFLLAHWGAEGAALLDRGRTILGAAEEAELRALAAQLPVALHGEGGPPRLVFAGQYSAGKSSLIKALTGLDDIAVGAAITTDVTRSIPWSGLELIDTPGIHTRLRPEHDERSYKAIADADLLVFVVTNELMDSDIAQHFRELAIERHKAAEMILVVNKMDRASDSPALRAAIRADLARVVTPIDIDRLPLVFVSAQLALDAASAPDPASAGEDREASGLSALTDALNRLAAERGTAGRLTTGLYQLEHALLCALAAASSDGDPATEAMEQLLLQRRRVLREGIHDVRRDALTTIHRTTTQVREKGREVSAEISSSTNKEALEALLQAAADAVTALSDTLDADLQGQIQSAVERLQRELKLVGEGEFWRQVEPLLQTVLQDAVDAAGLSPEGARKGTAIAGKVASLGQFLVKHGFKPGTSTFGGLLKLRPYSGTGVHEGVKLVGKFFGMKFKPWEAIKWARGITNAGRVLGVVGAVASVFFQIAEDRAQTREEKKLAEARAEVRSNFNSAADTIDLTFNKAVGAFIAEHLEPELRATDAQLAELRGLQERRSASFDALYALLGDTRGLIQRIHEQLAGS